MSRKFPASDHLISGNALEAIWRQVYMALITDDGTPSMAIRGDRRRDLAQLLGALLETAEDSGVTYIRLKESQE